MSDYLYGLDLSLASTGVAIFDLNTYQPIHITSIQTSPKESRGNRLMHIANEFNKLRKEYPPTEIAYEEVHIRFKEATRALYMVHGVVQIVFRNDEIEPVGFAASTIKKTITGSGKAEKSKVLEAIQLNFPDLDFSNNGKDSDVSDAVGVAVAYLIKHRRLEWNIPA